MASESKSDEKRLLSIDFCKVRLLFMLTAGPDAAVVAIVLNYVDDAERSQVGLMTRVQCVQWERAYTVQPEYKHSRELF
jgi:hypothetical protein